MSPEHQARLKRAAQADYEFHARRSPFIVRAALMFNTPTNEVTDAQYAAAVRATENDTIPPEVLRSNRHD